MWRVEYVMKDGNRTFRNYKWMEESQVRKIAESKTTRRKIGLAVAFKKVY